MVYDGDAIKLVNQRESCLSEEKASRGSMNGTIGIGQKTY
jgi:hypothetical protein